jgi:hypothetical protein
LPNTLTHYYIAEKVLDALDSRSKQLIMPYKRLYLLGAQGPDILLGLMLDKDKDKSEAAELLHEKYVYAGLANTAKYLASNQRDGEIYAYYMGCLAHYAADSVIHPYVYQYVSHRMKQKFDPMLNNCLHTIIESEMELFVGHYLLKGKNADSIKHIGGSKKYRDVVRRYYLEVNKDVFGLKLTKKDIFKSFFFYRLLVALCHRHKNGKLRFRLFAWLDNYMKAEHLLLAALRPRNPETRYDYLNMEKLPYKAVDTSQDAPTANYSFPEMVEASIEKGIKAVQLANGRIFNGVEMPLEFFDIHYNGGYNEEVYPNVKPAAVAGDPEDE